MQANARWALRFWLACVLGVAALILLAWAVVGFEALDLAPHAQIALALGTIFTVAIGAGLMTLVFYSARSGSDDEADWRHR